MFEFKNGELLWYLWLIPLLVVIFILARYLRKRALRRFGDPGLMATLMPEVSGWRPVIKFILFAASLAFIILTLAGPRFGSRLEEVKREGVEIIIALDVSNSMLAEDLRPNRLERSKMAINRMLGNLRNDRIGILVFAGEAYVQVPITSDYAAARMILENITTDIVPVQGTAIGRAISLAERSFSPGTEASRVLIIISDGEDHEDDPVAAAAATRERGITIHTIGIGRPEGAPIPLGRGQSRFLADDEGNTVITRLDEATLRSIAAAGDGMYIRAGGSGTGLSTILEEIGNMERVGLEEMVYTEFDERFQYMAAFALILLIMDFLLLNRRNRLLSGIRFFGLWPLLAFIVFAAGTQKVSAQSDRRHIREGNRLYNKELFDESELSYRRALESEEDSPRARFNLGNALYKQERFDEAARYFGQLADEIDDPLNRSKIFHNLGNSMLMMQQLEQSIEAYKEALRNNPGDPETRYNLAFAQSLLDESGQPEGGEDRQEGGDGEDGDDGDHRDDTDGSDDGDDSDDERDQQGEDRPQEDDADEADHSGRPDQISPEDAMRMLEAAGREEQRVLEKLMEQKDQEQRPRSGRNW